MAASITRTASTMEVSTTLNDIGLEAVVPEVTPIEKKEYLYKIYDSSGNFITTLSDVTNEPTFSVEINGGFSELTVRLPRIPRNGSIYDEGGAIAYGNILRLYCFDSESGYSGTLIYSGVLTRYVPTVSGKNEYVDVSFLSRFLQMNQMMLEDSGATEVSYSLQDPVYIFRDIFDKFTADGGVLDYATGTTEATGITTKYTFNTVSYQEAIKKVIELSPYNWYFRMDPDDTVYYKQKSETADHILTLGREIFEYIPEKRTENIVNTLYVTGGGTPKLYYKYQDATSVATYGVCSMRYSDSSIIDESTAQIIANRIFNNLANPEIRVTLTISDSNDVSGNGYDIESFHVGDTVRLRNATEKGETKWDVAVFDTDVWDYEITNASGLVLQIVRIEYSPDSAVLELSNLQPNIAKRIEEVNKAFVASRMADNPTTPS